MCNKMSKNAFPERIRKYKLTELAARSVSAGRTVAAALHRVASEF